MLRSWLMRDGKDSAQAAPAPGKVPFLVSFLGKLVLDVLPAALASVIGGVLFTQYQIGHTAPSRDAAAVSAPVSAAMMQLVRDEHAMMVKFLDAQAAAEKRRLAAEDKADARAVAEAKNAEVAVAEAASRRAAAIVAANAASRAAAAAARGKAASAAPSKVAAAAPSKTATAAPPPPQTPLLIAQATPNSPPAIDGSDNAPAVFLAKTRDIRDHVLAATVRAVAVLGGIPSWIASMGDHPSQGPAPDSDERMFSARS